MTPPQPRDDAYLRSWRVDAQYLDRPHDTQIQVGLLASGPAPRLGISIGNDVPVTVQPHQAHQLRGFLKWAINAYHHTLGDSQSATTPRLRRTLSADGTPADPLPPAPAWATTSEHCDGGKYYERRPTRDLYCRDIDQDESVIPADVRLSTHHLPQNPTGPTHQYPPQITISGHDEPIYLDLVQAAQLRDAITELLEAAGGAAT